MSIMKIIVPSLKEIRKLEGKLSKKGNVHDCGHELI